MEVTITENAKAPLSNVQFRGKRDGTPPKAALAAWKWLEDQLKSGEQELNSEPDKGWGEIPMEHPPPLVVQTIGYLPSESKVNRCYRHLQERLKIKAATVTNVRRQAPSGDGRDGPVGNEGRRVVCRIGVLVPADLLVDPVMRDDVHLVDHGHVHRVLQATIYHHNLLAARRSGPNAYVEMLGLPRNDRRLVNPSIGCRQRPWFRRVGRSHPS